ncbi:MAG: ATP phosphoribosyltransferase regulatory subunit [Qingshengfaniella sp.]
MSRLDALAEAARQRALFEAAGAVPVEADILLPAETLLDLYGEDIRARAYVTADPLRGEMMLRPDFTVPVVQAHMENGAEPARYTYSGPVFRKQEDDPDRPSEYLQVGVEIFDGANPAHADAEVFCLIAQALQPLGLRAATGDIGILTAAVAGLTTSPERRAALTRHIWRPRRFRALLDRYSGALRMPKRRKALLERIARGDDLLAGIPQVGLRSADEIRARLDLLVRDAEEPPITRAELDLLDQITGLKTNCAAALEALRDIAVDLASIQPAVQRFADRLAALSEAGIDPVGLDFEGSFGRTSMEYYDGFVFGFMAPGRPDLPPVASGGRYDALTRILGRGKSIPAVGGVIRPEIALAVQGAGR